MFQSAMMGSVIRPEVVMAVPSKFVTAARQACKVLAKQRPLHRRLSMEKHVLCY